MRTLLNPTADHIKEIEKWLLQEWNDRKEGFIQNEEMILEAFEENRLSILTKNNNAIAFAVFRVYDEMAVIDIAEIKPADRGKGMAKKFIYDTLDYLKSIGVVVVKLFCSPEKSEVFWNKCGFLKYEFPYNSQINMYKTLVEDLKPNKTSIESKSDKLKLWNCEPHLADSNEPLWIWELIYEKDDQTLMKPIIFPAFYDWQVQLEKADQKITCKLKYFPIDLSDNGTFMIINKIEKENH